MHRSIQGRRQFQGQDIVKKQGFKQIVEQAYNIAVTMEVEDNLSIQLEEYARSILKWTLTEIVWMFANIGTDSRLINRYMVEKVACLKKYQGMFNEINMKEDGKTKHIEH